MSTGDTRCSRQAGHAGEHVWIRNVDPAWNAFGECEAAPIAPPVRATLQVSHLRDLAQYLLAASIQHERGQLTPQAVSLLREWTLANDYVKALTGEFALSHTATVMRRAIGMLHADQAAKDDASAEVQATLSMDEALKNKLADGGWEAAGDMLSVVAIAAYLSALTRRQS